MLLTYINPDKHHSSLGLTAVRETKEGRTVVSSPEKFKTNPQPTHGLTATVKGRKALTLVLSVLYNGKIVDQRVYRCGGQ